MEASLVPIWKQANWKPVPALWFLCTSATERFPLSDVTTGAEPRIRGELTQGPKPKAYVTPNPIKFTY